MARKKDATSAQGDTENELDESADPATSETEGDGNDPVEEAVGEPLAPGTVMSSEDATSAQGDLHKRLENAVRAVETGPQHTHFALHTVELLTGRLKTVLPEAIQAASDEGLKADLQSLLNTL